MDTRLTPSGTALLRALPVPVEPLRVGRSGRITWPDEPDHATAYAADPAGYALLAVLPDVSTAQRARILFQLLGSSWAGHDDATRDILDRVARMLVFALPAKTVATIVLALRHRRANHRHVTRAVHRLLFARPDAGPFVAGHRRMARDCFEHALGKSTARGLAGRTTNARIRALYQAGAATAPNATAPNATTPNATTPGDGHRPVDLDLAPPRPDAVTVTNRGELSAVLVRKLRGGRGAGIEAEIDRRADAAAACVPYHPGRVAVVLDRSPSMRGYGDREHALHAQVTALDLVLRRRCAEAVPVPTGAAGTDLAGALVTALRAEPDVVAIVSDGYENAYPGDLARVVATLPRIGVRTPVLFCHPMFGYGDDLTGRRPAPDLPERTFWHERDFGPLMMWLLAWTGTAPARQALRTALLARLDLVERGMS